MSIQEPAWLKRTRPCPFFSRGRCLFGDSCNFLHDVKARSTVNQSQFSAIPVKQPSLPPKPTFDPPSVIVNSASPRSVNLATPESPASSITDSSRYSGLLSVLSDVIGPLPNPSTTDPDSEDTLVHPSGCQTKSFSLEADGELVAAFLPIPDDEDPAHGHITSCLVENMGTYVVGSEDEVEGDDDEDINICGEEDATMIISNRQSALSSFTGASLLASPRNSVFGESCVASPTESGAVVLLSPVQLSAKLHPFPVPSAGFKVKRGDSIDSGYADGDSWVSPLPFPRSPPTSFRSSLTFLSHSRRASHSSPAFYDRRVSYDVRVGALRSSSHHPIEAIKEVESDENSKDNGDIAYAILSAYDASPVEERGENEVCASLQVSVIAEEKTEEGEVPLEAPAVTHIPRRHSPEHLHPTREYDLDSCNQPSSVSEDSSSFQTALSTQPSYEDLSDISKISPIKQDSLLSYISGSSTPNTSVLSHHDGAGERLEQPIVSSQVCESSYLATVTGMAGHIDSTWASGVLTSEECSLPEKVAIDSKVLFTSTSADDLQGPASEMVVSPQGTLSSAFHSDRRSPISRLSVDTSRSLCSVPNILGHVPQGAGDLRGSAPEGVVTPRERSSSAFHLDKRPPQSSPSTKISRSPSVNDPFISAPLGADDLQEFSPEFVAIAAREHLPSIFHYDRRSPKSSPSTESPNNSSLCKDVSGYAATDAGDVLELSPGDVIAPQKRSSGITHVDKRSPKLSSPAGRPRSQSSIEDVLSYAPEGTDGKHDGLLLNVVAPRKHLSSVFHFDQDPSEWSPSIESSHSPSSVKDVLRYASPGANDVQEVAPDNVVVSQEYMSSVLHLDEALPKSSPSAYSSHSGFSVQGSDADSDDSMSLESSLTVAHDYFVECAACEADQSLVVEGSPGSDEVTGSFESKYEDFTQRLSFPLPPFMPVDFVGHSTLNGGEHTSVPSKEVVANLEKDVSSACKMSQHDEAQRIGSDLTERARPSRLPPVESLDSDTDFTLRRNRAASDLTVKGKSPMTTSGDNSYILRSPTPPQEQPGRSDSVQSLYDQYFDEGTSDDASEFSSSPAHKGVALSEVFRPTEESSQDVQLQSLDPTSHASPCSGGKPSNSGADSPRSETILRPVLTGRTPFLPSSLSEPVPKANLEESSPVHLSTRLEVREIGSTKVPLGFRRHKPQLTTTQSLRSASQSLQAVHSPTTFREALRIRTDVPAENAPPKCFSASHDSFIAQSPLPAKPMSAPPATELKQLRLSSIINKRSSTLSNHSSSIASSILSLEHIFNSSTPQSPTVSSTTSFSRNSLLSSSCERIPEQINHTLKRASPDPLIPQTADNTYSASQSSSTCRNSRSVSAPIQQPKSWRLSHYRAGSRNYTSVDGTHRFSRTSTLSLSCAVDEEQETDEQASTISRPIKSKQADDWNRPASVLAVPVHAIATPKPTLLFAIASDNVDQVRQALESGEAGPNDSVGPQSALAFTLTNDKLAHKQEIVKALLAYGANPSALRNPTLNPAPRKEGGDEPSVPPPETTLEGMDPATRYFVARADAAHTRQTSQLIYRSFFRPLTRVRYDVIGQDLALEQLFRVLSMHSQKMAIAPIVVLLCGPSGHGKSLLARKFGSLLNVPTHTVNMTTLRSTHDIWQSYCMSPYEEPSSCTLAEFLIENEGERCVVVLDEIEKVEDQKALWSLLMPWELGRCPLEAGKRHVDARNVIWLGTSNIGHELVFEHHENRAEPDKRMSREEYLELTGMLRPRVSHSLGASLVSRVTTVLPFVPFTLDEKKAIAAEAVYVVAGDTSRMLSPQDVESLVTKALTSYHPSEGARSLHRAVSNILVDAI